MMQNPDFYILNGDMYPRLENTGLNSFSIGTLRHDTRDKLFPHMFAQSGGTLRKGQVILFKPLAGGWCEVVGIWVEQSTENAFRSPTPVYRHVAIYVHKRHLLRATL